MIRTLGVGGNATVYLAKHLKLLNFRAIKRIDKRNKLYDQIINEANILKNLKHIHIPIIYDIEEDDKYAYIIEEYMEGITLKNYRLKNNRISEDIIIKYALQLCDLVEYLHSSKNRILYLDLKPDNIIISDDVIKLIDFGSAVFYEDLDKRRYATGTRGYASPEQYKSNLIDERSDIYGLGMLLFFLVTGVSFNKNVKSIVNIDEIHSCSNYLKNIINKCLKLNPSMRYQNIQELKSNLLECTWKKNIYPFKKSNKTLTISIAGSQNRIGVTHISLLLTTYLNNFIAKSLYSEKNNTQTVNNIINRYQNVNRCDYIYQVNNCYMLPNYNQPVEYDNNDYTYEIKDYGVLSEYNRDEFLNADYKCLLIGAKDWELEYSENALRLLNNCEDIIYLFNYTDGKTYQEMMRSMNTVNTFRIPYEPNPFEISNQKSIENMVNEIFQIAPKKYKRIITKIWSRVT